MPPPDQHLRIEQRCKDLPVEQFNALNLALASSSIKAITEHDTGEKLTRVEGELFIISSFSSTTFFPSRPNSFD